MFKSQRHNRYTTGFLPAFSQVLLGNNKRDFRIKENNNEQNTRLPQQVGVSVQSNAGWVSVLLTSLCLGEGGRGIYIMILIIVHSIYVNITDRAMIGNLWVVLV